MTTAADARDTRDRILDATIRLLRRQGYTATGIKQIVAEGNAPLGSVYHYFPGGKEQIGIEALARSGERIRSTIARAGDAPDLPAAINQYFVVNAERLRDSDYQRGCPIATVALETSSDIEPIRRVCEDVFGSWQATLTQVFVDAGIAESDAEPLATFVLSSYEGALTMSRALRDIQPMLTSGAAVASVLHAHLGDAPRRLIDIARDSRLVLEAGLWAALGQSALLVGALLVARFPKLTEPRWLGLVMAFGAGALISAITTDLVVPAYDAAGRAPAGIGLLVGAVGYYALTTWLNARSEREDPEEPVEEAEDLAGDSAVPSGADATAARNLTVGMVLDGIPESIAIGLTLLGGGTVSIALVGAVFLSNLPDAIGVAAALLAGGIQLRRVMLRFSAIVLVGFVAGLAGYAILKPSEADLIAIIQTIAAGAMVVVCVNEMVPIAVRGAGRRAGLAAAAGFAAAAFLSTIG